MRCTRRYGPGGTGRSRCTDEDASDRTGISLRQRLWPVIDMLKRALDAKQPVVWGV